MSADAEADVEETSDTDDGQPEMTEDDMADVSAVADQIAEESAETTSEETTEDDQPEPTDDAEDDATEMEPGTPDISVGDMYANGLGLMAALGRTRYGSADEDQREDLADEYADMARQIGVDQYLDQYMEESGRMDDLGPGQAVVVSTMMFGGFVMMDDPEMAAGALDAADRGDDE